MLKWGGNMLSLQRNGRQDDGDYGAIDDVTFSYSGNQLVKADDDAEDPTYAGAFNFVDGSDADVEYEYDQNGNMTKDLNKNISSIQYNSLNLPQTISFGNGNVIQNTYSASGVKLKADYYVSQMNQTQASLLTSRSYCGSCIYEDGQLQQILVDGGYVTLNGTTPTYHFYLKDHLGNNRVVANADGTIEQVNHYYPYGGLMGESTGGDTQRYKYNGKELDRMHGLDWYDYGARYMDGARGQFTTIDPLAGKYYAISPYAYCNNCPIKLVDSNGEEPTTYEAALMAKHVYGDNVKLVGGWHPSKNQNKSFNSESGLQSALYERTKGGSTEYAYVTAGTQNLTDAKEDIKQLYGASTQYEESVTNAKQLNEKLSDSELTYVGHSLGGGLAAANALATDRNAITFNAAAISKETKNALGLPKTTSKGRIFNVVVKGEIVNYLQSKAGLKLEGGAFQLNATYLPGTNPINTAKRINNHSINTVIQKLEEEKAK